MSRDVGVGGGISRCEFGRMTVSISSPRKGLAMSWPFLALSVVILLTLQNGNDINVTSDTGPAIEAR